MDEKNAIKNKNIFSNIDIYMIGKKELVNFEFSFKDLNMCYALDIKNLEEQKNIKFEKDDINKCNELGENSELKKLREKRKNETDEDIRKILDQKIEKQEAEDKKRLEREKKIAEKEKRIAEKAEQKVKPVFTNTIDYLKKRIFVMKTGGYCVVENGEVVFKSVQTFNEIYAKKINSFDGTIMKDFLKINDKLYNMDVFDGDYIIDTQKCNINLIQQLNFFPTDTDYAHGDYKKTVKSGEKVFEFIKNIIVSNLEDQYECLLDILTCIVRRKMSNIILVLAGLEGCGKSFFVGLIQKLIGSAMAKCSESQLSGTDNFNSNFQGCSVAYMEETSGCNNYRGMMRTLKELADSEEISIRKMNTDRYNIRNTLNFIICTNHYRDIDVGNRKVFLAQVSPDRMNDTDYFSKLGKLLNHDVLQYVFDVLYRRPLKDRIQIPASDIKQAKKENDTNTCVDFIINQYLVKRAANSIALKQAFEDYQTYSIGRKFRMEKDSFYYNFKIYLKPCINENGEQKKVHGYPVFDTSYDSVYAMMVTKTKSISEQTLKERQEAYENEKINEMSVLDNALDHDDLKTENEKLKAENEELKKRIAELMAKAGPDEDEGEAEFKKFVEKQLNKGNKITKKEAIDRNRKAKDYTCDEIDDLIERQLNQF